MPTQNIYYCIAFQVPHFIFWYISRCMDMCAYGRRTYHSFMEHIHTVGSSSSSTHIKFNILFNPLNVFANLSFNSHYTNFTIKNMFLIHMPCVTANIYRQNYNLYFDFQQPICEKPMPKNKTIIYRDSYRLTNLFAYSCVHVEYTIIISCVEVICEVQVSLHDLAL